MPIQPTSILRSKRFCTLLLLILCVALARGETVQTRAGDTLWSVAGHYQTPSVSRRQAMAAFLRKNPDAFIDGRYEKMRPNVVLHIPSVADFAREPAVAASQFYDEQKAALALLAPAPKLYALSSHPPQQGDTGKPVASSQSTHTAKPPPAERPAKDSTPSPTTKSERDVVKKTHGHSEPPAAKAAADPSAASRQAAAKPPPPADASDQPTAGVQSTGVQPTGVQPAGVQPADVPPSASLPTAGSTATAVPQTTVIAPLPAAATVGTEHRPATTTLVFPPPGVADGVVAKEPAYVDTPTRETKLRWAMIAAAVIAVLGIIAAFGRRLLKLGNNTESDQPLTPVAQAPDLLLGEGDRGSFATPAADALPRGRQERVTVSGRIRASGEHSAVLRRGADLAQPSLPEQGGSESAPVSQPPPQHQAPSPVSPSATSPPVERVASSEMVTATLSGKEAIPNAIGARPTKVNIVKVIEEVESTLSDPNASGLDQAEQLGKTAHDLNGPDSTAYKLRMAEPYFELGLDELAYELLQEVSVTGSDEQRQAAEAIIARHQARKASKPA